jgi:AcrR family transcriptional regulator
MHSSALILPVMQRRSGDTVVALMDSAQALLEDGGYHSATVSSIAAKANVSVGAVYRRFKDKESLFAAVYERYYTESVARRTRQLNQSVCGKTFRSAVGYILSDILDRNRRNAALLRPYWVSQMPADKRLRGRIDALNSRGFELIVEFLSSYEDASTSLRRRAVRFALLSTVYTLRATVLPNVSPPLDVPMSDRELIRELTSSFLAYVRSK